MGDAWGDVSGDGIDPSWPSRELVQALRPHAGAMGVGAALVALAAVLAGASLVAGIGYDLFPRWFRWFNVALTVVLALSFLPVGSTGLMAVLGISWFFVASLLFAAGEPDDLPGTG